MTLEKEESGQYHKDDQDTFESAIYGKSVSFHSLCNIHQVQRLIAFAMVANEIFSCPSETLFPAGRDVKFFSGLEQAKASMMEVISTSP